MAGTSPSLAMDIVDSALGRGVNYVDVAPTYGNAEELLGPAVREHRDEIFLACKTTQRMRRDADRELHKSLRNLQTDHFDLYQIHGISSVEEAQRVLADDGALGALRKARKHELVRFLGFSAHSVKAALMLMDAFDFDSVLFPINFVLFFRENLGPQILQKAEEKGMAVLALKGLALGKWSTHARREEYPKCWYQPMVDPGFAEMALRFTLSQSVTAAIPPGDPRLFRMAMDFASRYKPISQAETETLRALAEETEPIFQLDV